MATIEVSGTFITAGEGYVGCTSYVCCDITQEFNTTVDYTSAAGNVLTVQIANDSSGKPRLTILPKGDAPNCVTPARLRSLDNKLALKAIAANPKGSAKGGAKAAVSKKALKKKITKK